MKKSIIKIKNLDELNLVKLNNNINDYGYSILSGLFDPKKIERGLINLKKNYKSKLDNSTLSGDYLKIQRNFQKLCIGSSSLNDEPIYRLHRIIYNPLWSKNIYKLKDIFIEFCKIRNYILNKKENYCIDKIEDNLWSACRILQYPIGGGHMSEHSDYILKDVSKKNNTNFLQLILLLSEKGKDFEQGGAYIKNKNNFIDLEKYAKRGDILIYKSTLKHGVKEIDPFKKLNLEKINGRVVLMNSLYQNFNKSKIKSKYYSK